MRFVPLRSHLSLMGPAKKGRMIYDMNLKKFRTYIMFSLKVCFQHVLCSCLCLVKVIPLISVSVGSGSLLVRISGWSQFINVRDGPDVGTLPLLDLSYRPPMQR